MCGPVIGDLIIYSRFVPKGNSDIDEGVLSFYPGSNAADITVELVGPTGRAVYPINALSNLCDVNFDHRRKTIVFANGWVSNPARDIKRKLQEITVDRDDYNLIIVDFATCITHLYKTSTHDIELASYALLRVLDTLVVQKGVHYKDIILVGFSVGAHIAAAASEAVTNHRLRRKHKLPLLVAIDPSHVIRQECHFLNPDAADQVLVIHGNNGIFGSAEQLGTVDYYPNGDCRVQPGCKSQICSHIRSLWLFVEAVCKPDSFIATKCDSWEDWKKGKCNKNEVAAINLDLPRAVQGKFYGRTNSEEPFGQGKDGASSKSRTSKCAAKWRY